MVLDFALDDADIYKMKGLVNMEYAKLGNTDIEVSKLCVGCMSFGKPGTLHDWTLDENGTEEIVKYALDLGSIFLILRTDIRTERVKNILEMHLEKMFQETKLLSLQKFILTPEGFLPMRSTGKSKAV